jgi:menaquinone-dependent protoporphyrinogen oxidase
MQRILVVYATKYGSTREVAESVAAGLAEHGLQTEFCEAKAAATLEGYDAVVLGSGIYVGRLHKDAQRFLRRHRATLAELPFFVFGMGPGDLEPEHVEESRAQVGKSLEQVPELQPRSVAIFGGVVDPAKLPFPLRRVVPAMDARDWDAIHAWTGEVAAAVRGVPVATA